MGQPATLQKHVALLHERGLLTLSLSPRGRKYLEDFAGLYALSSEYHEWDQSKDYIAPLIEFAELIKQNPNLMTKLRRFDVYKKILYKGAKLTEAEITQWYASTGEVQHG